MTSNTSTSETTSNLRLSALASDGTSTRRAQPIPPASRLGASIADWLREVIARRDLLLLLAWREIKVKYKQSVMGFLWAILMPTIIVSAGIVVKYAFASLSGTTLGKAELTSVAVRSIPWAFFVASIRFSSTSLVSNSNLVTKIYMPRVIFPISSVLSQVLDLSVSTLVLAVFLTIIRTDVTIQFLWLPLLLSIHIILVTGVAIFISAAALFLRDVKYIVEVILTFAIFFTPVFYEVAMVGRWQALLLLNPVAPLLEGFGAIVAGGALPLTGWILYSAAVSICLFAGSLLFFWKVEPYFAEAV
jgi:ABC-type polysaccharide/polyol phosphate export permease